MSASIIAVVNLSHKVSDADVTSMVIACQHQLTNDVDPVWELSKWFIIFYADRTKVPARAYQIAIMDTPDSPGALGYHSEMNGKAYGRIFVNPVLENGGVVLFDPNNPHNVSVASVLSHEIIEARIDRTVNFWVDGPKIAHGSVYAMEACDPVQGDSYTTHAAGKPVSVSNFVLPAWFDMQASGKTQVDFLGTAPGAFQLAKGGYMVVRGAGAGTEKEVFGKTLPPQWRMDTKKHPTSRTARRMSTILKVGWFKKLIKWLAL